MTSKSVCKMIGSTRTTTSGWHGWLEMMMGARIRLGVVGRILDRAGFTRMRKPAKNQFPLQSQLVVASAYWYQTRYLSFFKESSTPGHRLLQRAFASNISTRTNELVRKVTQVLLVNESGERVGVMSGEQAYQYAVSVQQDLMEVAAKANPPVWKLVDLKQVMRANRLREKMERKQAAEQRRKMEVKEIRISPAIDHHDFQVKVDKAKGFLSSGRRVRFTIRFRKGQGKYAVRLESLVVSRRRCLECRVIYDRIGADQRTFKGHSVYSTSEKKTKTSS